MPLAPRDPHEEHRTATPLELFFDLTFVVAVAQAGSVLHHQLVDGHAADGLLAYPIVFFAVWWAWMNFTWFASAYDCDDALYRVMVFVQMAGVLVLAAAVPRFFEDLDPSMAVVGYVIIRVAQVGQWLHAGQRRYTLGILLCQVVWVVLALTTDGGWWLLAAMALAPLELLVPVWAEGDQRTPWHPRHIAERYGLFTIIVLGESVLAATVAVQVAVDAGGEVKDLVVLAVGGLLIVASMWWVYFDMPIESLVERARATFERHEDATAFLWGYGHYFVFASAAATGVGLAVNVDQRVGHTELTDLEAALTLTVPVAVYLLSVWVLHYRAKAPGPLRTFGVPVAATLILAASWMPRPAVVTGILLAALVALAVSQGSLARTAER